MTACSAPPLAPALGPHPVHQVQQRGHQQRALQPQRAAPRCQQPPVTLDQLPHQRRRCVARLEVAWKGGRQGAREGQQG